MSRSESAPPREAVEAAAMELPGAWGALGCSAVAEAVLDAGNRLPAAARWRLIGWLAEGLEPTRGMAAAFAHAWEYAPDKGIPGHITAALAAAREGGGDV